MLLRCWAWAWASGTASEPAADSSESGLVATVASLPPAPSSSLRWPPTPMPLQITHSVYTRPHLYLYYYTSSSSRASSLCVYPRVCLYGRGDVGALLCVNWEGVVFERSGTRVSQFCVGLGDCRLIGSCCREYLPCLLSGLCWEGCWMTVGSPLWIGIFRRFGRSECFVKLFKHAFSRERRTCPCTDKMSFFEMKKARCFFFIIYSNVFLAIGLDLNRTEYINFRSSTNFDNFFRIERLYFGSFRCL